MPENAVTLSRETIHNPAEPRHFMRIKPTGRRVRVLRDGAVLAESVNAVRVVEIGRDVYDPVLYFPPADVSERLALSSAAQTHCPLKGDAEYLDLTDESGAVIREKIAWRYQGAYDFASALSGLVAFYLDECAVEEGPL